MAEAFNELTLPAAKADWIVQMCEKNDKMLDMAVPAFMELFAVDPRV